MSNTNDIYSRYDLDEDDWQVAEHVSYLLDVLSLDFTDSVSSLDQLDEVESQLEYIGDCCLMECYNDKVCSLAEKATVRFLRLKTMISAIIAKEIEHAVDEARSELMDDILLQKEADLLIDAANKQYNPNQLAEKIIRATEIIGLDEKNNYLDHYYNSHTGIEALDIYFTEMKDWSEKFIANVVVDGFDKAFQNIFAPIFENTNIVNMLKSLAQDEARFLGKPYSDPLMVAFVESAADGKHCYY